MPASFNLSEKVLNLPEGRPLDDDSGIGCGFSALGIAGLVWVLVFTHPDVLQIHWGLLALILVGCWLGVSGLSLKLSTKFRTMSISQENRSSWASYRAACAQYRKALEDYDRSVEEEVIRRRETRKRVEAENRRKLEWWRSLDGKRFERQVAELFRLQGFGVDNVGHSGDGGVDLILKRADKVIIVQCKAYSGLVGPGPVRDLYGTLLHHGAHEAWLVTTGGYSRGAQDFAQRKPIRLFTIEHVLRYTPASKPSLEGESSRLKG